MYKSTVELSTSHSCQTFYTDGELPDNDDIDFTPTTGQEEEDTEKVKARPANSYTKKPIVRVVADSIPESGLIGHENFGPLLLYFSCIHFVHKIAFLG